MKLAIPKTKTLLLIFVFIASLVASRVVNLDKTARFLWDESDDLVHMHGIYVEKKLTLLGPVSEDGSEIFSSLTYYMLLPFAVVGQFDPVSPAYGAAFWGVMTGILILYLCYVVNKKFIFLIAPVIILWYPLVATGRWAWNPNLIPFWVSLSLIFFFRKNSFSKFLSGLFIGLSIHHHYLAVFAVAGLTLMAFKQAVDEKEIRKFFIFLLGATVAVSPFVLFDLTHPPGLFLSRFLYFNKLEGGASFFQNLIVVGNGSFFYFTQLPALKFALIALTILLIAFDIKKRSRAVWFMGVVLMQIVGAGFVKNFNSHYILPAVPFFIVYIIYPRKNIGKLLSVSALGVLLVSGLYSFPKQITGVTWEGNIAATRFIADTIEGEIKADNSKNNNLAVLGSPDPNTYGKRYRDLLLIKGLSLRTKGEYEISDHLYLITTSSLETVRKDPAYEIKYFRTGEPIKSWEVPGSPWSVYLLNKSI